MRTLLALLLTILASACFAADTIATFDMSFNLQGSSVDKSAKMAAIARIDKEARGIALEVFGREITEGLKLSVLESTVPNGFSTHIECYLSLATALGQERLVSVHQAFGERFEQLVAGGAKADRISDPAYLPLPDFVLRYRKKGKSPTRRQSQRAQPHRDRCSRGPLILYSAFVRASPLSAWLIFDVRCQGTGKYRHVGSPQIPPL